MKDYDVYNGIPLDHTFAQHILTCSDCVKVNSANSATLRHLCLEGAVLWKRENQEKRKTGEKIVDDHIVKKSEMWRHMKYK